MGTLVITSAERSAIQYGDNFTVTVFKLHKVSIIVLLKIENKGEIDTSSIIFNSASLQKFKFVLDFILLATVCKLLTLEVMQKCQ